MDERYAISIIQVIMAWRFPTIVLDHSRASKDLFRSTVDSSLELIYTQAERIKGVR